MSETRARAVNENQCHMCMPLGGVVAFKGIEGAMVLVHGSQGCSTYMRLANVEHYNEPIDVASSALNEKQTIYGGEKNLTKALDNVIRVYNPSVIGIVTTCLAETMGEDIPRMIEAYSRERQVQGIEIIPVATPSYGGSHTEGFWAATKGLVTHFARPTAPHRRINVIIPHISPADIREIRRLLDLMELEYTLIPDYSMTLDRPFGGRYQKIPPGGTPPTAIAAMPGAPATIQFGTTCPDDLSPGLYLQQQFGVPLITLPLPIGLQNTDLLMKTLQRLSGRPLPEALSLERGWLLDGMADAHKYNAEGRPVIYGEPELVNACTGLCLENGAVPAVIASGGNVSRLWEVLKPQLIDADDEPVLLEEADIAAIAAAARRTKANIAIGHSGGRSLTERQGIPIVRIGFPIHDRVGGQRLLSAGYAGTLAFLDRFTNKLLEAKYATYRQQRREELLTCGGT